MKKIVALILVLCMSFGMVVTATAANPFAKRLNLVRLIRTMFAQIGDGADDTPAVEIPDSIDTTRDKSTVYDRVVIIGIDGAGSFIRKANMPEFDKIFEDGAIIYRASATAPINHAEAWCSILTGVTADFHKTNMTGVDYAPYLPDSKYPTIFRLTREAYPDANIASFATWSEFNVGLIEDNINVYKDTADTDAELSAKVVDYIKANDPKLLFVEFDEVTQAGQTKDFGSPEYISVLEGTDKYISDIYKALEAKGYAENTLFIVTTDHGGSGKYYGNASQSVVTNCTFAAKGKTVDPEFDSKNMLSLDIAAVVAYAMAIKEPESWTAMVPDGLFVGYEAGERPEGIPLYDTDNTEMADDLDVSALRENDGDDKYDRVIIIGVDGAGTFDYAETPYINKIISAGTATYTAQTVTPSISTQAWTSMFHGVEPEIHGETNSTTGDYYDPDSAYPSFMRVVREADPEANLASFSTWGDINHGIIEENIGVYKVYPADDADNTAKIIEYITANDPKVLYVQYDYVDKAGHGTGFGSQHYINQLEITDGYIGQLMKKLNELGYLEDTLVIITSDHGGTETGNHGGGSTEEMTTMIAVAGKTVVKGGKMTSLDSRGNEIAPRITDIAAIVLYALGYDAPDTWTATVPGGLFEGVEATVRPEPTIPYVVDHRDNESQSSPEGGVTSAIDAGRILAYQNLDKNSGAAIGGEAQYVDGFFGEAVKLDGGYVEIPDFAPEKDSFSIAFWFKTPLHKFSEPDNDSVVLTNKAWNGIDQGFLVSLNYEYTSMDYNMFRLKFNFADGTDRMDCEFPLPEDWQDGWVHVILSVDREAGTVGVSYDFGAFGKQQIPEELKDASMNGEGGLILGQDSSYEYASLPGTIDDMIVISGAVTAEDVAALAAYYGIK
ncbi:MAG: alkaline phosphatase family protein [Clostridia bacterium]|nr:alkaline phosphatase family protein [Clostridia bacterium]